MGRDSRDPREPHEPTSNRTLLTGFIVLAVAMLILTGLVTVALVRLSDQSGETQVLTSRLSDTQQRLVSAQHSFAVSQKASTETRVSTVTQRCDLTRLILGVLVRVHDQVDAAPFEASQAKCLKQLRTVKTINARTPTP